MDISQNKIKLKNKKFKKFDTATFTPQSNDPNSGELSILEFVGREERNLLIDDISTKTINTNSIDQDQDYFEIIET